MSTQKYRVEVVCQGPVFIGMGKTLRKNEYIYDYYKSLVFMVNGPKFTKYLSEHQKLDAYLKYLDQSGSRADLRKFLSSEKIPQVDWQFFTTGVERVNVAEANKNSADKNGRRTGTVKVMNDLQLFIRDGQGAPYIPGSSLKGALRTAILEDSKDDTKDNPLFNKIAVSDSLPIDPSNLAIYQKIDINKIAKPLPLYRECLEVGTKIIFSLTIDDEAISIAEIENRIREFYKNYWNRWFVGMTKTEGGKVFLENGGVTKNVLAQTRPLAFYLGGGAGFVSKTLQYQMFEKEVAKKRVFKELQSRFPLYRKFLQTPQNVPLVLKATNNRSQNKWYQQGLCTIRFSEI